MASRRGGERGASAERTSAGRGASSRARRGAAFVLSEADADDADGDADDGEEHAEPGEFDDFIDDDDEDDDDASEDDEQLTFAPGPASIEDTHGPAAVAGGGAPASPSGAGGASGAAEPQVRRRPPLHPPH